ncbi:MAG TPA: phosphotransferase [Streptosporangiaceae bacterium]|nr:phosphotransferase [Streptosporangiaceae bacterium]
MLDLLLTRGATLVCLADGGYRAPRVIRTWAGDVVGLDGIEARVPDDWRPMYAQFRRTALEIQRGLGGLPRGVVHGDARPGNAVQTGTGTVTLIDWETGGSGLPVLDLGNCLLECLLDAEPRSAAPEEWHVQPDEPRIAAVAQGYSAHRALSACEQALLLEAIRFGAAYAGAIHFEQALAGGVRGAAMDARLDRLRNRLTVSQAVAELAAHHLASDGEDGETVR